MTIDESGKQKMPRDSNGIFSLPSGYTAVAGQTIEPSQHNPPLEDIRDALTASLPRNGAAAMTGALNMGAQRITNVGAATAGTDAISRDVADARYLQAAPAASGIAFTPTGAIAATNVQTAIAEVDTEKAPKASPNFTGTVTIGDSNFKFEVTGGNPYIIATPGDYILYDRSAEQWQFWVDGVLRFTVSASFGGFEPISTASSGIGQVVAINVGSSAFTLPAGSATYEYFCTGYATGLVVNSTAGVAVGGTTVYNDGSAGEVRGYYKRLT
jgi:hypothetical protein